MTFATKKEADEYDKMLDIADNVSEFLENSKLGLDDIQIQDVSLCLAQNRESLMSILKGISPQKKAVSPPPAREAVQRKPKARKEPAEPVA